MSAKIYRTIRKPYTFLLNTRSGYISISRSGASFSVSLFSRENLRVNDIYEEVPRSCFDEIWDDFTSRASDIHAEANNDAFRLGNKVEETVAKAKEIITRSS